MRNLPNALTLSRLFLAVGVFIAIDAQAFGVAVVLMLVAAATDWLDGFFARLLGVSSALGRQLDPLVDKVLMCGSFVYLLSVPGGRTGLAFWMVTLIIARELIVQAVRGLVEGRGMAFGARWCGKLKTTFQFLAILAILILLAGWIEGPTWVMIRNTLIWTAVGLTLYSGLFYLAVAWPLLLNDPERHSQRTAVDP